MKIKELASGTADVLVTDEHNKLFGYSLHATDAAEVILRDGEDATGKMVCVVSLTAGESVRDFFPGGIQLSTGLYVDRVTGTTKGSVWYD